MKNIAILFSGQGSQYPGMGKELYEQYPSVRRIYENASDILGFDVAAASFHASEEELSKTAVSQPVIYTHSLAVYAVLRERICTPFCVAGHSLGEYAAMTAAGGVSADDGFRIIGARAAAMQRASETTGGAMYAILGSTEAAVASACRQTAGYAVPVNYNSPAQTVIAGEAAAAAAAAELLKAQGAKAVKLAVSCAFHCALMQSAAEELKESLKGISFSAPKIPFYSNLDGKKRERIDPDYLAAHLTSPVLFTTELDNMARVGVEYFLEAGPGKVLTGLVKRTLRGVPCANAEDPRSLEKAAALLQKE